jgi:hypothetical protein
MLPPDYDRRAWILLARMAGVVVLFSAVVVLAAEAALWVFGWRSLLLAALLAEAAFAVHYQERYDKPVFNGLQHTSAGLYRR